MKLSVRKYQTATKVKVMSHEKYNIKEADSVHLLESSRNCIAKVRDNSLFRGLSPWYDIERDIRELGRSEQFSHQRIFANNLKRREGGKDCSEVGLIHSRGVTGVTPCAFRGMGHSKGSAVLCRGEGKRKLYKETDKTCKQN